MLNSLLLVIRFQSDLFAVFSFMLTAPYFAIFAL